MKFLKLLFNTLAISFMVLIVLIITLSWTINTSDKKLEKSIDELFK